MDHQPPKGLYEKLVENAGDVIAVLDEQGTIEFVNSRVQHYRGLTALETVGKHYSDFVHADDLDQFQAQLKAAFEDDAPVVDYEFRVNVPDDTTRYWIANGSVHEHDGKRLMMAICRDVSEAVDLKSELLSRNKALAALGEIAVALSRCENLDEGLGQALDQVLTALGLCVGAIVLAGSDGNPRIAATSAPDLERLCAAAMSAGKLISQECLARNEQILVSDVMGADVDPLARDLARALTVEALMSLPLVCKTNVKACLTLGILPHTHLSAEQADFLQLAAGILGPAIENAALHNDLTDRVDRLAMLERLAKSINSGRDVENVLSTCMREVAQLVPYDMGVVVLFGPESTAGIYPFAPGGVLQPRRSMALNSAQVDHVLEVTGPTQIHDGHQMGSYHTQPGTFDMKGGSAGIVPLVRMGEKFGLLKVWSQQTGRYGAREMEILAAAAEHLSIAASNAAMYEGEQKRSLELAALASEVRHRIKNNLQMISGLLEMARTDPGMGERTIGRCLRQVSAISAIHDLLSPHDMSTRIQMKDCLIAVADNAVQATGRPEEITVSVTGNDCTISSDAATALGVMVNELVSNSVEHGFRGMEHGNIGIHIACDEAGWVVEITDDGLGLPEGFVLPRNARTAGLGLVCSLAEYGLGGKLELEGMERGVRARISVKGARSGIAGIGS